MTNIYKILIGKPHEKRSRERPMHNFGDNIKIVLREIWCEDGD
jgi:hypothetical protein